MAAVFIAKRFSKSVVRPSTERVSRGRQSEELVAGLCPDHGYLVHSRNIRFKIGEVDILASDGAGKLVVIEVRSRVGKRFRPSWNLSYPKQKRLRTMATILGQKFRRPVRVELWEVIWIGSEPTVKRFLVD